MRTVTLYETVDGRRFESYDAAGKHEELFNRVLTILTNLGARPNRIGNGGGYVQHNPSVVQAVRVQVAQLLNEATGRDFPPDRIRAATLANSIATDLGGPISTAVERLSCIDAQAREWSDPYFAMNPGQGTHNMVEDRRT